MPGAEEGQAHFAVAVKVGVEAHEAVACRATLECHEQHSSYNGTQRAFKEPS